MDWQGNIYMYFFLELKPTCELLRCSSFEFDEFLNFSFVGRGRGLIEFLS